MPSAPSFYYCGHTCIPRGCTSRTGLLWKRRSLHNHLRNAHSHPQCSELCPGIKNGLKLFIEGKQQPEGYSWQMLAAIRDSSPDVHLNSPSVSEHISSTPEDTSEKMDVDRPWNDQPPELLMDENLPLKERLGDCTSEDQQKALPMSIAYNSLSSPTFLNEGGITGPLVPLSDLNTFEFCPSDLTDLNEDGILEPHIPIPQAENHPFAFPSSDCHTISHSINILFIPDINLKMRGDPSNDPSFIKVRDHPNGVPEYSWRKIGSNRFFIQEWVSNGFYGL